MSLALQIKYLQSRGNAFLCRVNNEISTGKNSFANLESLHLEQSSAGVVRLLHHSGGLDL